MSTINEYSSKINEYLKSLNKIEYKKKIFDIKNKNISCWYCNETTEENNRFCSIICQRIYDSNDIFSQENDSMISMFPFEYLTYESKIKYLELLNNIKNIEYDNVSIMYKLKNKNKSFDIIIKLINKYKIIDIKIINIFLIINKVIDSCIYCNINTIDENIYLKNNFFFIGYFCSNFCLESFIFRNKFLPFNISSKLIICGKEYFENFYDIKKKFKNKVELYTTIINNKINILYNKDINYGNYKTKKK